MSYTPLDLFREVLPKTNCGDCGYPTCLAFAFAAVQEQKPLDNCPNIEAELLESARARLEEQQRQGRHLRRDLARDALAWARWRAASLEYEQVARRVGGLLVEEGGCPVVKLPFWGDDVLIDWQDIRSGRGRELSLWERVLLYNHLAQGGSRPPTGEWIAIEQLPNSVAKAQTLAEDVERPLSERFTGRTEELRRRGELLDGQALDAGDSGADLLLQFLPLPRVPIRLLFWDAEPDEGFAARVKLLFDQTVGEHLDLESLVFLAENLRDRLLTG